MSTRRKSGLSKDDLEALKHLPAVIRALENLAEEHAKVRALMGAGAFPAVTDVQRFEVIKNGIGAPTGVVLDRARGIIHQLPGAVMETPETPTPTAILDTPERREYEAAKKAGKEVPPDMANISDAQRERMAEQRALIQAERQRKGLPPSASATAAPTPGEEDVSVRVEELPATVNGSVGAEEE